MCGGTFSIAARSAGVVSPVRTAAVILGEARPALRRDVADALPWFREILVNVRAQRLQRRNVEDPDFVWKRSAQAFCEEIIDRRQKGRERLAGSGRRRDERVTPFADGRPAATLRSRRLAQRFRKPLLNNGVEGGVPIGIGLKERVC